jgi:hypothetical protein
LSSLIEQSGGNHHSLILDQEERGLS